MRGVRLSSPGLGDEDGVLDQIDLAVKLTEEANLAITPQRGVLELTGEVARRYWGIEL